VEREGRRNAFLCAVLSCAVFGFGERLKAESRASTRVGIEKRVRTYVRLYVRTGARNQAFSSSAFLPSFFSATTYLGFFRNFECEKHLLIAVFARANSQVDASIADDVERGVFSAYAAGFWSPRSHRAWGAVSHARTQVVARAGAFTSHMSLAASVRARAVSSIHASRASRSRLSSPVGAKHSAHACHSTVISLTHAQAAAARVAPRHGLSSRGRAAPGAVALRAQPRSKTVARSAPYTPLKINAVRQRTIGKPVASENLSESSVRFQSEKANRGF